MARRIRVTVLLAFMTLSCTDHTNVAAATDSSGPEALAWSAQGAGSDWLDPVLEVEAAPSEVSDAA